MTSRFTLNRQTGVIMLLFVVFVAAILLLGQTERSERLYDPEGRGPAGLYLLQRWFEKMGYTFHTTAGPVFTLPSDLDLLLVYPDREPFREAEANQLLAWVEAGGTLAIINNQNSTLAAAFGYTWQDPDLESFGLSAYQSQPLLPAAAPILEGPGPAWLPQPGNADEVVVVLADEDGTPVVWAQPRGEGWLWLFPSRYAFTNADLMDGEQGHLLLALLRFVPDGGQVAVDTYHLFGPELVNDGIVTMQDWLYQTWLGWATLLLLGLFALYLILSGRRLGPPLKLMSQGRRREAAEFVVAMAGLQQRARVRDSLARHHRHRLLLALGRPHHIPADLPTAEFLARLRQSEVGLNPQRLARIEQLLNELETFPDTPTLVRLVSEIDQIIQRKL